MGRVASPPRGIGPALLGRRTAPASAISLSSSARPPPCRLLSSSSGDRVALLVVVHDGPAAAATDLPPAGPCVPTPLAEAESAHLSPPPKTDPKPYLGPSGLGLPARRRTRCRFAVTPLPQPLTGVLQPPAGRFRIPQVPCGSVDRTVTATPAAGVEAVAGGRVRWRYWRPQHLVWSLSYLRRTDVDVAPEAGGKGLSAYAGVVKLTRGPPNALPTVGYGAFQSRHRVRIAVPEDGAGPPERTPASVDAWADGRCSLTVHLRQAVPTSLSGRVAGSPLHGTSRRISPPPIPVRCVGCLDPHTHSLDAGPGQSQVRVRGRPHQHPVRSKAALVVEGIDPIRPAFPLGRVSPHSARRGQVRGPHRCQVLGVLRPNLADYALHHPHLGPHHRGRVRG